MFEFVDGRRRLTRYGQTLFVIVFLMLCGMGAAVYMSTHKTDGQDNSGDIKTVIGAVVTVAGIIWINAKVQRIEDINHRQSEKLERIDSNVGSSEQAAIEAIRAEWQRDRHDLRGQISVWQMKAEMAEGELKTVLKQMSELKVTVKDLTERLASASDAKSHAEGKAEGEHGAHI